VTRKTKARIALSLAVTLAQLWSTASAAADWRPIWTTTAPPTFSVELGGRYWAGWGKTAKDLYNVAGNALVSRLTYDKLPSHSAEVFGRFDHSYGWFVKGYLGIGAFTKGRLQDEDFPPFITPYSSTDSNQKGGHLGYGAIDLGVSLVRGGDFRVGVFVGYHFLFEKVNAYGCTQTATNSTVCAGTIPTSILVITQANWWHSVRVGLEGQVLIGDRIKLNVDAAWLPYVKLSGTDNHWLRMGTTVGDFTGGIPEDGKGWGYQLEASVSYMLTRTASIGIGGRYWHMETKGNTHFENRVVGVVASPQPVNWKTD
jgi:outer membrane protease